MAFVLNPPGIPLDQINWEACGDDEADPKRRLLAQIRIGYLNMHLEAWEIDTSSSNSQTTLERSENFETLGNMMDCNFETITIDDREYFLIATPYGA